MSLEPLSCAGFATPPPRERGPVAQLRWIALAELRIDRAYQRDLTAESRRRIGAIAEGFSWPCFTPVVIAAAEGGGFALIDGQHRSIAAMLIGVESVPAMIVVADRAAQAASFAAINGNRTRMSSGAVFRAALAAGEPRTVTIDTLARECGVRVMTYAIATDNLKPNECASPNELARIYDRYGAEILRKTLAAALAAKGGSRGLLTNYYLRSLAMLFRDKPLSQRAIAAAFPHIDLRDALGEARRNGMKGVLTDLRDEIARRLLKLAKLAA